MAGVGVRAVFHRATEQLANVVEEREERIEAFVDGLRVAREVDHERVRARHGDATGEDGERRLLQAFGGEEEGDARHVTLGDVARGLGG